MANFERLAAVILVERMRAEVKAHMEKMNAFEELMLARMGLQKEVEQDERRREDLPRKDGGQNYRSAGGPIWEPVSICRAPTTAEETELGRWWVPAAEVGRRLQTVDPHAVLALRKGRCRRRPSKTTGSGIRGRSKRQELRVGSRRAFKRTITQARTGSREASSRVFHRAAENE
jgi:hypothetical protein